jgi:RND superfamily putative drug exporter
MSTDRTAPRDGAVARHARRMTRRRGRVLLAWTLAVVAAVGAFKAAGNRFSNSLTLPGTQSQAATDVLAREFPRRAGDQDQIVIATSQGTVQAPAVRARVAAALAQVARLPHVSGVESPYAPGAGTQRSADGRVAFAILTFDVQAREVPVDAIERVIAVARSVRAPGVRIALGGQAIEHARRPRLGPATAIGLLAAAVVLLLAFGSLLAMGLPIVTALLGLAAGISLAGLASHLIQIPDFATQLAAMIGLGVGIDYALFVVARFRENRRIGRPVDDAIAGAMDTAGRAVAFAGLTVIVALLGQVVLGVGLLSGLAVASGLTVLMTLLAAQTALPALLSRFGGRIASAPRGAAGGGWLRWSHAVARRPVAGLGAGLAIMLALAVPALSLRTGASDAGNDVPGSTTREAYDLLAAGFGPGVNGPLSVVVDLGRAGDDAPVRRVEGVLRADPDVAAVGVPAFSPARTTALLQVYPRSAPEAAATTALIRRLRGGPLARVALIGGASASAIDFSGVVSGKLPLFVAIVLLISTLLLAVVFRSVAIPLQAAAMNLLSIGASLGVVVAIFQWGWLGGVLGVSPGPIEGFIPEVLFAIVFGLSMDYEVFIVSRIREHWLRGHDAREAIHHGMATTGRLVTAAATIMICVFASFALGDVRDIKLFGISMAVAVLLDAFVVRSLLLPALLQLLGHRTWWLPERIGRRMPRVALEEG